METQLRILLSPSHEEGICAEELGEALSLSRAELDEALNSIRDKGRLLEVRDDRVRIPTFDGPLSEARLRSRESGVPGWNGIFLEEVDSTNEEAWRLLDRGEAPGGTIVAADTQSAGRGRGGNRWHSPPRTGLWFSVVLSLDLPGERVSLLTQMVGLQLSKALQTLLGVSTRVKWPNDLHLEGRKVAGILTEARSQEGKDTAAVVGIGLNVNQEPGDFPCELASMATSLREHTGWPLDRALVLDAFLDTLADGVALLRGADLEPLDAALKARSAVLGKRVRIQGHGGDFTGKVTEQSLTRGLVLETDAGEALEFRGEMIHSLDLLR